MIRLGAAGLSGFPGSRALARLRHAFARDLHARLPGLLSPLLSARIRARACRTPFREFDNGGAGFDLRPSENAAEAFLIVLFNDPGLLHLVSEVAGLGSVTAFTGHLYRMEPRRRHRYHWHDDLNPPERAVALSINLDDAPFQGGDLRIRDRRSRRVLWTLPNPGLGDALLFPLHPRLQHQVTRVAGGASRLAFAGWFLSTPPLRRTLGLGDGRANRAGKPNHGTGSPSFRSCVPGDAVWRQEGDRTFLARPGSRSVAELDAVGSRTWELLARGLSREEVSAVLCREYRAPRARIARDLDRLLVQLRQERLLTLA